MIESDRLITAHAASDEERQDRAIRPKRLQDYVGQVELRQQMEIFIQAAKLRGDALDRRGWVKPRWPMLSLRK